MPFKSTPIPVYRGYAFEYDHALIEIAEKDESITVTIDLHECSDVELSIFGGLIEMLMFEMDPFAIDTNDIDSKSGTIEIVMWASMSSIEVVELIESYSSKDRWMKRLMNIQRRRTNPASMSKRIAEIDDLRKSIHSDYKEPIYSKWLQGLDEPALKREQKRLESILKDEYVKSIYDGYSRSVTRRGWRRDENAYE